ncbi:ubiquitin-conjugating enzyme E2 U-like isoform X1 [Erpetoichthys calabaricus]|uniref:Ubiquitin conjugating enzyme E2 U n=1 Tax=Erpetoichthys calabaricus TaxID=27687 RepID=A0A8C4S9S0_ERPCA|nr:ubiquitin-conjugating enzyme E2 U-like isoform X1 [Erpetoichthys calabaricus]
MHSRAYLLLEKEYQELREANLYGIHAVPVNDSLFQWLVEIEGLKDSPWEGGSLQLTLQYNEDYNTAPPIVKFTTIPFHPNVDKHSGRPCISFLDNKELWEAGFTMATVLLAVQVLLSNPVTEDAVNLEAAEMCRTNPSLFTKVVLDCVSKSKRIKDEPDLGENSSPNLFSKYLGTTELDTCVKSVSFADYIKTWSGIATSKATQDLSNPVTLCSVHPSQSALHYGLQDMGVAEEMKAQNTEFSTIIYGSPVKPQKVGITNDEKMARVKRITRIHLQTRTPDSFGSPQAVSTRKAKERDNEDLWETEVDNLIAWTNTLCYAED